MADRIDGRGRSYESMAPEPKAGNEKRRKEKTDRAQFARAIARSEFGRYYWDARKESELKATLKRKP